MGTNSKTLLDQILRHDNIFLMKFVGFIYFRYSVTRSNQGSGSATPDFDKHMLLNNICYWTHGAEHTVLNTWCWTYVTEHMVLKTCYWTHGAEHALLNTWCWTYVTEHMVLNTCYWTLGAKHMLLNTWCWTYVTISPAHVQHEGAGEGHDDAAGRHEGGRQGDRVL